MADDNRLRLPPAKIDFDNDVGTTGQDHDDYPAAGQQPRWDWMRMYLVALLSNQSSHGEPSQFREGTLWFDTNDNTMKVRRAGAWVSVADAVKLDTDVDGGPVTLSGIYDTIKTILGYKPTASFGGHSNNDGVAIIPIPSSLRAAAGSGSRPLVWVDGVMIDPRRCEYVGGTSPASIRLTGGQKVDSGQEFTVLMLGIDQSLFSTGEVTL